MALTRIVDHLGRVLGGRYRLLAPIGSGASAHVFLADDVRLGRQVAVKVLQPALAADAAFLRRFRAEARAAAKLNHPHICRVFDWGEDEDGPFLVMEHLSGGSLRDLLDAGERLSAVQATTIGLQAASALDYAHRRGLVHRDIKPANLVFDEEGRPRIADFGIARALAEASWTEPLGAVLGTARYASPEQAQGEPLDGRSDVYALALVLVEAVTGQVPFAAESPSATLMARVGSPLPISEQLGPLGPVLRRAGAPDPTDRLDAADLVADLERVARTLPRPRPLPLVSAREDSAPDPRGTAPTGVDTTVPTFPEVGAAGAASPEVGAAGAASPEAGAAGAASPEAGAAGAGTTLSGPPVARHRRRWPWALLGAALLGASAAAAAVLVPRLTVPSHPVPALRDQLPAKASAALAPDHLRLAEHGSRYDPEVPAGAVADQSPLPGAMAKEGSTVTVILSAGPAPQPIPDLTGLDQTAAVQRLADAGLTASVIFAHSETAPSGAVMGWTPHRGLEPHGTRVTVTVSDGPALRAVPPGLAGGTYAQAASQLSAAGLVPVRNDVFDDTVAPGAVVDTSPGPGASLARGSQVTVDVSKGPDVVQVPNVVTQTVAEATATLAKLGLSVGGVYGPTHNGPVILTNPVAGTTVHRGTAVSLFVL